MRCSDNFAVLLPFSQILQIALFEVGCCRIAGVAAQKVRGFKGDDLFAIFVGGFQLAEHLAPFDHRETPRHIAVESFEVAPELYIESVADFFGRRHEIRQFSKVNMTIHECGIVNQTLHFCIKILKMLGVEFGGYGKLRFIFSARISR